MQICPLMEAIEAKREWPPGQHLTSQLITYLIASNIARITHYDYYDFTV